MVNFAERLKDIRKASGMTQMQVAAKSGLSQSNINTWERGRSMPLPDGLIALADCFGCSVDYLLGRESEDGAIVIQQSDSLNDNEIKVLDMFRTLNVRRQGLAMVYIAALYDSQVKGV